ncbi:MAG: Mrp/NBP35 family ATP-binding protein [Phycisphaerae bacterium]|nr:Mrp/NBP35 family ATP-binding protein [Phycisphaerae bacterium]
MALFKSNVVTRERVVDVLRAVNDPELHQDLVSLDMVRDVTVVDGEVRVHVELTTPACPLKDRIRSDIEAAVRTLSGVRGVAVEFSAPGGGQTCGHAHSSAAGHRVASVAEQVSLPDVHSVVAVGAGKGGVGKSTISVLVAVGLARRGAKVGLLDADVYGPSIPKMLGVEDQRPALVGDRIQPVRVHGLKVMSIGFLIGPQQAVVWRGPMIHGTIRQFLGQVEWGELDYLIVDLPPGTGDVPLTLSQSISMTGAVVVCTPQEVALLDAVRAARMYQQLNVEVLGVVENMSYFIAPDTGKAYDLFGKGGAERAAAGLGVPFLGSIPVNVAIRISGDAGTPEDVFERNPEGVAMAVDGMVTAIVAQVVSRQLRPNTHVSLTVHP